MTNATIDQLAWMSAKASPFASKCKDYMDRDPRRKYHNWSHVEACLYHAAFTYNLPYDQDLADAILSHDVIYDGRGDHEARSVTWVANQTGDTVSNPVEVCWHIMKTVDHSPTDDNRMMLIDLANFLDPKERDETRKRIIQESMLLYDASRVEVEHANIGFLIQLHDRLRPHRDTPREDVKYINKIRRNMAALF